METFNDPGRNAVTVSQLNDFIKLLIDGEPALNAVCVRGEIFNFKFHYASGHCYFSLKDEKSVIRCVMFAGNASKLKFKPDNGMKVLITGRVSVFPRDGSYQLYADRMTPDGVGELYVAFEQLKARLMAEGLFDASRKKPIPQYPSAIGLVTSASGAAVRDLCNVLGRRFPAAEILLYPALVQGAGAAASVADGIRYFNRKANVDVIIIGRGGGSIEDLWCFNDESLARTIATSELPLISAVGHEVDYTISDFVADLRAPTPSAAAELAVPDAAVLIRQLGNVGQRLNDLISVKIEKYRERLNILTTSGVLSSPMRSLELRENELAWLARRMDAAFSGILSRRETRFAALCGRIEAMSPLSVLERGYAAVTRTSADGGDRIVTEAADLHPGDRISVRFRDGAAQARIENVTPFSANEEHLAE